jgi:sterol desaturase/sphingolipid hydroxylase (fatty acid hydroxylase superfamily)
VHHFDTALDVSTTVRLHPAELLVQLAIGAPLVLALGLSPWVLMLYEILDAGVTVFSHANISLPTWIERWLRVLIVTPDLHRVHHSARQPETDSNFGAVLPFWDIVFGTYRTRSREQLASMRLGLAEIRDARAHGFAWLLTSPWRAIRAKAETTQEHAAPVTGARGGGAGASR